MPKNKNTLLLALPRNEKSTAMPPLWASQNFLTSRAIIHLLIQRTNLTKNDHVIEIGPGKGHITRALLERCCHVTAVELDRALYLRLTEQFKGAANLTLRNADFCSFSLPAKGPYKVFANIPFSRTTDIIRRLTECRTPPTDAYLILEKGAAKRFMGQPRETLRSLSLKPFFKMEILYHFRREDFHPKPSVDIVMLHIAKRAHPDLPAASARAYRAFLAKAYDGKTGLVGLFTRRQLSRALGEAGLTHDTTLASIRYIQWLCLFRCYAQQVLRHKF